MDTVTDDIALWYFDIYVAPSSAFILVNIVCLAIVCNTYAGARGTTHARRETQYKLASGSI